MNLADRMLLNRVLWLYMLEHAWEKMWLFCTKSDESQREKENFFYHPLLILITWKSTFSIVVPGGVTCFENVISNPLCKCHKSFFCNEVLKSIHENRSCLTAFLYWLFDAFIWSTLKLRNGRRLFINWQYSNYKLNLFPNRVRQLYSFHKLFFSHHQHHQSWLQWR